MPEILPGIRAVVYDAYGTLFDFASAAASCRDVLGDRTTALTTLWRDKQLQYSWLRTLQNRYVAFDQITADALDYAMATLGLDDPALRSRLLDLYRTLLPFPEVPGMLARLSAAGLPAAILSNGSPAMLAPLVARPGIGEHLHAVLSVDAVGAYKTDPRAYRLAVDRLSVPSETICFVSSNAWDAWAGADFGCSSVWCNRANQPPEHLPGRPAAILHDLCDLPALLLPA